MMKKNTSLCNNSVKIKRDVIPVTHVNKSSITKINIS